MPGEVNKPSASAAETIFLTALALSPSERPAFLATACADDQQLRQRVEALLRAHDAPEGFLPENPRSGPVMDPSDASLLTAQLIGQVGDTIGPYKLLQKIGEGGCGVVYMAEQQVPVRRKVALKVIKLGMDTRQVVARFEAERQALALMEHPNIARVIDAGATEIGRPYFVMELVGGIRITDYCEQNDLTTRQRLELFIQVCRAIQHAHQKGIIHRDIKPSNVLVTTQDGVAVPKVIDFGIAKATQGKLTDQTVFTAFEQFLGTPAYMSPEQTELGGLDVDTRSDIYSLGVLLYELLTGKTPFDAKELLALGLEILRKTIQEKDPLTPSTRLAQDLVAADVRRLKSSAEPKRTAPKETGASSRRLLQEVRGDLDWIVMKCLEKDRTRRYDTANGLAMDIERHLNNEPILAHPPSRLYEFQKTVRRHKFGFAATAAVIVALGVGTVVSTWEAVRARRAEREQSRLRQEAQAARQDATEKLWSSYLAEARALRVSGQAGRHFDSLATIRKAAAISNSLALRNEAIASMILPDIQWLGGKTNKTRDSLSLHPAFESYALCDETGTVSVRRVADDRVEARLPRVGVAANGAGFSPDGKFLIVCYADGHCRVWNWSTRATVLEVKFQTGCGFTPDGRSFVVLDKTNIVFQDVISGEPLNSISLSGLCAPSSPAELCFDPTRQRLALFHTEAYTNVAILDMRTGQILKTLKHPEQVWSVAWHPDGKHLATGCNDTTIRIWDSKTGELVRMWRADSISMGFNHRGDLLASSGWEGHTRLWEFATDPELIGVYGKTGHIIGFSSDDLRVATAGWEDNVLDFFEVASGQELRTLYKGPEPFGDGGDGGLRPIADSAGRLLAFRTHEGTELLDFQTGRQISSTKLEQAGRVVGFDRNSENVVLLNGREGLFRSAITRSDARHAPDIGDAILVDAHPFVGVEGWTSGNGKVCAISEGGSFHFFGMDTFEKLAETPAQTRLRYCAINFDGSLFASGIWQRPGVKVWNTQTGGLVKELPTRIETATVAFSPDGRYLVIGINDEYCFWEISSWTPTRRFPQEPGNDYAPFMAFTRDGRIFAGTHSRNKIRLHDAATGKVLADLAAPNARMISGLAFNHDGSLLAASESWDALRLWDLRKIRNQLAEMGLDWDEPRYPEAEPGQASAKGQVPAAAAALPTMSWR